MPTANGVQSEMLFLLHAITHFTGYIEFQELLHDMKMGQKMTLSYYSIKFWTCLMTFIPVSKEDLNWYKTKRARPNCSV
ncbi:hypothetical protein A9196_18555 [Aeromonas dhakensis]|nr:hypothetical protein A9196_18555 [Aeromonas dhakensis]